MSSPAFRAAEARANAAKSSGKKLSNDQLLQLYAYYKVATKGPNTTPKPGIFDVKGTAKWSAWQNVSATSRAQAEQQYIQMVNQWC
jgi:diazepam-binding inhibitor (GABA receptor modulating acyl-CoA-binding protein)